MELSCSTATRLLLPRSSSSYNLLPTTKPSSSLISSSNSIFFSKNGVDKKKLGLVSGASRGSAPSPRRRKVNGTCRCLFGLGVPELVVIAGVAALVFGPKQLPEIGRSIGKTFKSFQQAAKEFESELKKDPEDGSQPSAAEGLKAISSEEKKKELGTSDTKENV